MRIVPVRCLPAAVVAMAAIGAGYATVQGGPLPLAFLSGVCLAAAIVARARALVLAAAVLSLLAGSSAVPGLSTDVYYIRFLMFGVLATVSYLERPARGVRVLGSFAILLVAIVLLAAASALWSANPELTAARALGLALMIAAVLVAAHRAWQTEERLARDIATVASVFGIVLIAGLAVQFAGFDLVALGERFRGVLENPNTIGLVGAVVLPVAVGLAILRRGLVRTWWLTVATAATVSLFLSQSRNGLVSGGLGLLVLLVLLDLRRRPRGALPRVAILFFAAAVILVVLSSGVPAPAPVQAAISRIEGARTAGGRFAAWSVTLGLARQRPVTGWGFGTTADVFGPMTTSIFQEFQGALVHNSYLQALLELGPIGLILLLLVVGTALRHGWPSGRDHPLRAAVYAALVAGITSEIAESSLLSAGSVFAFPFWLIAAASVQLSILAKPDPHGRCEVRRPERGSLWPVPGARREN